MSYRNSFKRTPTCHGFPEAMPQQGIRMMPQLLTEHTRFYVTAPLSDRMT